MSDSKPTSGTEESPSTGPTTASGHHYDQCKSRQRDRNRQSGPTAIRFIGACDELKEHVYDTSSINPSAELFSTTTIAIGEYVAREYSGASEFRNGLPDMSLPILSPPSNPAASDPVALEIWKLDLQEYRKRVIERERNMGKIYSLLLGCSPTIRDRIEAFTEWADINSKSDAIRLLGLIRNSLYQRATRRKSTHALIDAETTLFRFNQGELMPNSEYLERMRELVEIYEQLGGEPGTSTTFDIDSATTTTKCLTEPWAPYVWGHQAINKRDTG